MPEIVCEKLPAQAVILDDGIVRYVNRIRWAGIKAGDTCQEFAGGGAFPKNNIHVFGTWNGASLPVQGRADLEADPLTLHDKTGELLVFDENDTAQLYETLQYLAPGAIVGGDEDTNLTVVMVFGG